MKFTIILFAITIFAAACSNTQISSDKEVALSAKEDARELALFKLLAK